MNSPFTQSPLWLTGGWVMLHFFWVGGAIGLFAAAGRWLLRPAKPHHRYAFALSCFVLLAASPLAVAVWLSSDLPSPPLPTEPSTALDSPVVAESRAEQPLATDLLVNESAPSPTAVPQGAERVDRLRSIALACARFLPWVWIIGAPVTLLTAVIGLIGVERLQRQSRRLGVGELPARCRRLAASLGIRRRVTLGVCERLTSPILIGVLRPLILLPPAALTGWSMEQVEMVLLHELAHVRRWDPLVNLAQRLVETILFFHPAVWWLSAWVRLEREICCDRVVVARTGRPREYADILATIAMPAPVIHNAALAMSENSLVTRIRFILNLEDQTMRFSLKSLALVVALLIASATIIGLYAQDAKPDGAAKDRESQQKKEAEAGKKNFWVDPVTGNQYYVGVQDPNDPKKNQPPPAGPALPKLPPGTLPPVNLPGQPLRGDGPGPNKAADSYKVPGEVEAYERVELYSRIAGYVEKVNVEIGDRVKKGQVLAEIAAPELNAEYRQKQAQVQQAKAEVEAAVGTVRATQAAVEAAKAQVAALQSEVKRAQADFTFRKTQVARMEELLKNRAIEQRIVDEARERLEAAKAAVETAEAKLLGGKAAVDRSQAKVVKTEADRKVAEAKLLVAEAAMQRAAVVLQFAKVRAPFDGVVARRALNVGDFALSPDHGKTEPLFVVARTDKVRIIVQVSGDAVTRLRVGTPAVIRIDALTGKVFEGKVARIAGAVDPTTRTLRAEIDLPNTDGKILPGMYGNVTLVLEK